MKHWKNKKSISEQFIATMIFFGVTILWGILIFFIACIFYLVVYSLK